MHNKVAIGNTRDIAGHNHTRNNGAGKFKNMTEPKVDGRPMLLRQRQLLASLLHNGSTKACTAQRGQKTQKGRHDCQRHLGAGKDALQSMHHPRQGTTRAQLNF